MSKDINQLMVPAKQKKTNKRLAQRQGKGPAAVSKWCTNTARLSFETLSEIARCLQVDVRTFLYSSSLFDMASEPVAKYNRKEGHHER